MLYGAGLRTFRVELLEESGLEAARVISLYQGSLIQQQSGDTLWRNLKAQTQLGVTTSTLRGDQMD